MPKEINIVVILGPTASGKSDLAVEIARKNDGEIISADSRQIYKDMNLGTGKVEGKWKRISNFQFPISNKISNDKFQISKKQSCLAGGSLFGKKGIGKRVFVYKNISHYLIDFVNPKKEYNIFHFKNDCEKLISEISWRGKTPIICGGTGFWVEAVVYDRILPSVEPNKKLRSLLCNKSAKELFKILEKLDSRRAKNIDSKNKQRLIRAIEIAKELGKVPEVKKGEYKIMKSEFNSHYSLSGLFPKETKKNKIIQLQKKNETWNFLLIGKRYLMEEISERIKNRLEKRFEKGMIKEIENLKEKYKLSWKKIQSFGLAYYWIPMYLQNKISLEELKQRVFWAERQYAKRQMTWLKRDKNINWL